MAAEAKAVATESRPHAARWREESWTSPNGWKIQLIRLCYRYRILLWGLWWVSLIASAWTAFFFMGDWRSAKLTARQILGEPEIWVLAGLVGASLLGTVLLIAVFGWFGVGFRYLAWGAAILSGAAMRLLRARWRGLVVFFASLLLAWIGYKTALQTGLWGDGDEKAVQSWQVGTGILAFATLSLAALLWGGYRSSQRIVVQAFRDLTGLPELQSRTNGLSERLCGELAAIAQLYHLIADMQGGRRNRVYSPAVEVLDVGDLLQSAVSAETSLDLKLVKIPIGPLLRFGGRLLHQGWLSGSLHQEGGSLLLLAKMSGGGREKNWKVEPADLDEQDRRKPLPCLLDKMIQQLAYRIATDLVATGSPKWRAVRSFTEGLRAFREAQRTEIKRYPRLRRAERAFLQALGEDQKFAQCHYNLGIVYLEMGEGEPAEAAFRRALQNDPEPSAACYALAEGYFYASRYPDALWFAKNAIRIRPADMRFWHLTALSLYFSRVRPLVNAKKAVRSALWQEVLEAEEVAMAFAWRDLCQWLARGSESETAAFLTLRDRRGEVATYSISLGVANGLRGENAGLAAVGRLRKWWTRRWARRGAQIFRQASRLKSDYSFVYYEWGRFLFQNGDFLASAQVLDRVFTGALGRHDDRIDFWRYVLVARAGLAVTQKNGDHNIIAQEAYEYLLDYLGIAGGDELLQLAKRTKEVREDLEKVLNWAREQVGRDLQDPRADLATIVGELQWSLEEDRQAYTARLELLAYELEPREHPILYHWRLESVAGHLERLADVEPKGLALIVKEKDTWFHALRESLDSVCWPFEEADRPVPEFLEVLIYLLQAAREDWQWAQAQAEARLGMSFLTGNKPERARQFLQEAVHRLEVGRRHTLQIAEQGLYARLAHACRLEAESARGESDARRRTNLLREGLNRAETAVALRPEGAYEHYVLGRIYLELGDYGRAQGEWEMCLFLRPDPEVLNLVGEAHWRRALELGCSQARREAMLQAVDAFEHALELLESDPDGALEARGQAHIWLGMFHRELLGFDKAILHHKVAWSMGVRSLEALASLGWDYLEGGRYAEAETAFRNVRKAAVRQLADDKASTVDGLIAGMGEPMPVEEILVRSYLGSALLYVEWGVRLRLAEALLRRAFRYLRGVRSYKRMELLARCCECRGWIHQTRYQLGRGTSADLAVAARHLGHAIQLHARCDSYCILATVHLSRAEAHRSQRTMELQRAREACERARRTDLRGRRQRDIEVLLGRIEAAHMTAAGPRRTTKKPKKAGGKASQEEMAGKSKQQARSRAARES